MGNKYSCCVYSSPKGSRKKREEHYAYQPRQEDGALTANDRSAGSLPGVPHISDRENYPEGIT